MIRATRVLGQHRWTEAAADSVLLDFDDRHRRRLAMTGTRGLAFVLDLAQCCKEDLQKLHGNLIRRVRPGRRNNYSVEFMQRAEEAGGAPEIPEKALDVGVHMCLRD